MNRNGRYKNNFVWSKNVTDTKFKKRKISSQVHIKQCTYKREISKYSIRTSRHLCTHAWKKGRTEAWNSLVLRRERERDVFSSQHIPLSLDMSRSVREWRRWGSELRIGTQAVHLFRWCFLYACNCMLGETGSNLLKCPAFCLRDFEVCEYEETQQQDSEDDKNVWTTEELCEREREKERW